jgi:hypothetical protein
VLGGRSNENLPLSLVLVLLVSLVAMLFAEPASRRVAGGLGSAPHVESRR